jgi:hypothetical protein
MDGVSLVNALVHSSDPACPRAFFSLDKPNALKRLLNAPLALMKVPSGIIAGMKLPPDKNPLTPVPYSGDKTMGMTVPLSLAMHLARAKALGVTFNDYIIAAVLRAISAYISQQHGATHHNFTLGFPISFRGHPTDGSPLPPENDVAYIILPMPVVTSPTLPQEISQMIKQVSASTAVVQSSDLISRQLTFVPRKISRKFLRIMGDKVTVALSNMQGPKAPLSYGGVQIKSLYVAPVAAMPVTAAVISYAEHFTIAFTTDVAVIKDASVLTRLITAELSKSQEHNST